MINYSIIIPHYNTPELLGRCLRSIPERDDVQVIVVDDNSPENEKYPTSISELNRDNVEFYVTKDGLGAGHARNIGLRYATGKWLVFSDSDDFFNTNLSDTMDEFLNDEEHDIIYFNVKSCDCYETNILMPKDKLKIYRETGDEYALRICHTEPWGKFIRRSLVVDNEIFFQETKAHNDLLFSVKVGLAAKSIMAIDKPIYWYVIRQGSLAHQNGIESFSKLSDRIRAWNSTQELLENNNINTKIYLPVMTLRRTLPNHLGLYFRLLRFMQKEKMNFGRALLDTIRYSFIRLYGDVEQLRFYNLLDKESLEARQRSVF